jgi:3-hydroxyisobutyrate dehydrogenase-like beta-hydroxyacid dehydrogenase
MDVGFAGLGHMGLPMATRLAGHGETRVAGGDEPPAVLAG